MRLDINPGGRWPAAVLLEVEPLASQPYDLAAWRHRLVAGALGGDPEHETAAATTTGFPVELVESDTVVVALYRFIDHVGVAVARARDAATLAAHRDLVLALLRDARPDWGGSEVACLMQLWES